jgi:predicted O-methyltransferase YrrM
MVDLPQGPGGRLGSSKILKDNADEMRERGVNTTVILADSQDQETVSLVAQHAPFDFVFIDGDHSYECTLSDWEHYGPMGNIVAFHDITGDGKGKHPERFKVGMVFDAIKKYKPTFEIVEYGRKMGIGVVWNGDK